MNDASTIENPYRSLSIGHRIGEYEITEMLAQDTLEVTYLARKRDVGDSVLVREFFPFGAVARAIDGSVRPTGQFGAQLLDAGLASIRDQAYILAKIDHPNIERVVDYIGTDGTGYMLSRWEEGEKLTTILARGSPLDEESTLALFLPLIDGLAQVHATGLAHGNIRPSRILVRPDGVPVLVGFASARWQLARVPGCPIVLHPSSYSPIEQLSTVGQSVPRPTGDIYALGATIYQAVTGLVPPDALARAGVVLGQPDPLRPAKQDAAKLSSSHLLSAIDRALILAEEDRPQDLAAWRAMMTGVEPPIPLPNPHKALIGLSFDARRPSGKRARKASNAVLALATTAALGVAAFHFFPNLTDRLSKPGDTKPRVADPATMLKDPAGADRVALDKFGESPSSRGPAHTAPTRKVKEANGPATTRTVPERLVSDPDQLSSSPTVVAPSAGVDTIEQTPADASPAASASKSAGQKSTADMLAPLTPRPDNSRDPSHPRPTAPKSGSDIRPPLQTPSPNTRALPLPTVEKPLPKSAFPAPSTQASVEANEPDDRRTPNTSPPAAIQSRHSNEIARLLGAAKEDLLAWRLKTPVGNNAFDSYLEVLKLDPENADAVDGMKNLAERYEGLASKAERGGNRERALLYINRALAALESNQLSALIDLSLRGTFEDDIERLRSMRASLSGEAGSDR